MKISLPATIVATALTIGLSVPVDAHMGGMGRAGVSASASAFAHASVGVRGRGFGFHHRFLPPHDRFENAEVCFGCGFVSHRVAEVTGGYGDYDYASDEDYGPYAGDDIDNLHFRVQEPFGPGDIGRPPVRAEENAPYMSDRMDPWHGYEPQD